MELPAAYQQLVNALDQLPSVGPKAAARLAQHLLNNETAPLLQALTRVANEVVRCTQCQTFSNESLCACCSNASRDTAQLLIVETIDEQLKAEASGWHGLYFVLHGLLSPMAARGPRQLGIPVLQDMLTRLDIQQVLIATESSAEGKATFQFIASLPELSDKKVEWIIWEHWAAQQETQCRV